MPQLVLRAPLAGWCLPLADVPDPAFADGLVGDGVAIDPTEGVLRAPCDGEIVASPRTPHGLTVRTADGVEVLMHVGLDTVQLAGAGFEPLVANGDRVKTGDALLRFDLDAVARGARSLVSPVIIASGSTGTIWRKKERCLVGAGDVLLYVMVDATNATDAEATR